MGSPQDVHYMKGRTQGGRLPRSRKRRASSPRPIRQGGHSECLLLPSQRAFGARGRRERERWMRLSVRSRRAPTSSKPRPTTSHCFQVVRFHSQSSSTPAVYYPLVPACGLCFALAAGMALAAAPWLQVLSCSGALPALAAALWHVWYVPAIHAALSCRLVMPPIHVGLGAMVEWSYSLRHHHRCHCLFDGRPPSMVMQLCIPRCQPRRSGAVNWLVMPTLWTGYDPLGFSCWRGG